MVIQLIKQGFANVNRTKRMVLFAWIVNATLALTLVLPFFGQLNEYLRTSVREDELLNEFSANWYESWQADMQGNETVRLVDYTMFGYAPFLNHTETVLGGTIVKSVGSFFYTLVIYRTVSTPGILTMLTFVYLLVNTFLAGAFIGTYARDYRLSFTDFLMEGAKHFGRFFRLSLLSLLVYFLLFLWVFDVLTSAIPDWTANSPSEMTPFLLYIAKNVIVLFILSVVTMCVDYAKVRVVVEERISAIIALMAGARFALGHFRETFGVHVCLTLIGVGLMVLYAITERQIPQQSYWMIALAFVIGQLYIIARMWLKASFYASQTALYQSASGNPVTRITE